MCCALTTVDGHSIGDGCNHVDSSSDDSDGYESGEVIDLENTGIYVLALENGFFYVGKSSDIEARLQQHFSGDGAQFTRLYRPLEEIETITPRMDDLEAWERIETLEQALVHGIDKVRGHRFTSVHLSMQQRKCFFEEVVERYDLCRRCGRDSHMVNECHATTMAHWAEANGI
jgi:predicted GIY-YIG superfamily endonuclease